MASEKLKEMKDAVFSGQGGTTISDNLAAQHSPSATQLLTPKIIGGLQETSTVAGEVLGESSDMRGKQGKKSDDASASLGQFGKGWYCPSFATLAILMVCRRCRSNN